MKTFALLTCVLAMPLFLLPPAVSFADSEPVTETGTAVQPEDELSDDELLDDLLADELADDDALAAPVLVPDPLLHWNQAMYQVNDRLYFWLLKPVASGYRAAVPTPLRQAVRNWFHNIAAPARFVSCALQGKFAAAGGELGGFLMNSTAGMLGFGNPARRFPALNPEAEDLGQTFGVWGADHGFYLVWPLLGPSSLRDTVGTVGEIFLDPLYWYVDPSLARLGITAVDVVNETSFRIGDYEALKAAAIEPYSALRDAYIQHRDEKTAR